MRVERPADAPAAVPGKHPQFDPGVLEVVPLGQVDAQLADGVITVVGQPVLLQVPRPAEPEQKDVAMSGRWREVWLLVGPYELRDLVRRLGGLRVVRVEVDNAQA